MSAFFTRSKQPVKIEYNLIGEVRNLRADDTVTITADIIVPNVFLSENAHAILPLIDGDRELGWMTIRPDPIKPLIKPPKKLTKRSRIRRMIARLLKLPRS